MNTSAERLPVAGLVPLTTVDYPGHLAMVVFTQGCRWHCPYCHNGAMRPLGVPGQLRWTQVREQLERRRGFLEAVVFSGGEPTLHAGLGEALRQVRALGFLAGLHTAGMCPDRLRGVLPLLGWVGLDLKAPFDERYARLTGDPQGAARAQSSLALVRAAGIPYQLRTTVIPTPEGERDFADLCAALDRQGFPRPVRQLARGQAQA